MWEAESSYRALWKKVGDADLSGKGVLRRNVKQE